MVSAVEDRRPAPARTRPRGHRGRAGAAAGHGASLRCQPTADPVVYDLEVRCSKGTYIRTLADDLGRLCGGGAHLRGLRRTAVGAFTLAEAAGTDDVRAAPPWRGGPRLRRRYRRAERPPCRQRTYAGPRGNGSTVTARGPWSTPTGALLACYEARRSEAKPCCGTSLDRTPVAPTSVAGRASVVTDPASPCRRGPASAAVVTIGAYDGVHLGHQAVIDRGARRACRGHRGALGRDHVRSPPGIGVVRPEIGTAAADRSGAEARAAGSTGVDATVVVRFDERPSRRRAAESFVDSGSSSIACRPRSSWSVRTSTSGVDREGNVDTLRELGVDADFEVQPSSWSTVSTGSTNRSASTAIRRAHGRWRRSSGRLACWVTPSRRGARCSQATNVGGCSASRRPTSRCPSGICLPADGVYAGWYYERPNGIVHACAHQPRSPAHVLRARRHVTARGAPARRSTVDLYGETARVAFRTSCAASASSTASMR